MPALFLLGIVVALLFIILIKLTNDEAEAETVAEVKKRAEKMEKLPDYTAELEQMREAHRTALSDFEKTLDSFYSSEASREGIRNEAVYEEAYEKWEQEVCGSCSEMIERGEAVLLHEFGELKNDLHRMLNNVLERNWKGISLVRGLGISGDRYGTSYYYDNELKFFFKLFPDGDINNWGTYKYCFIPSTEAKEEFPDQAHIPVNINVPEYFAGMRENYADIREIYLRTH